MAKGSFKGIISRIFKICSSASVSKCLLKHPAKIAFLTPSRRLESHAERPSHGDTRIHPNQAPTNLES